MQVSLLFKEAEEKFNKNPNSKTAKKLSEARKNLAKFESDQRVEKFNKNKTEDFLRIEKMQIQRLTNLLNSARKYF